MTNLQSEYIDQNKYSQLNTLQDINEYLAQCILREKQINTELDELISRNLETEIDIDQIRNVLRKSGEDAQGLSVIIEKTWGVARGMSEKVRSLDIEQSNMRSAAQILDDIQDLKTCLYRAEEDIAAGEIEAACVHVKKYLTYTNVSDIETIYNETHVLADINPMSPIEDTAGLLGPSPITALKAVHKKLTTILLDAFDASVASNSTNEMIRIFKLFPEISQDRFSAYVCNMVSNHCKEGLKMAAEKQLKEQLGEISVYVNLITRLFEVTATMIDGQEAMVETHYGPGSMYIVLLRLQREVDSQSSLLLNGFMEARHIDKKIKDIRKEQDTVFKNIQTLTEPLVEPRELDKILGELASICEKAHLFDRFLRIRAKDKLELLKVQYAANSNNISPPETDEISGLSKMSKLNEIIQGFISNFVTLGDYFVSKSIQKAIRIDSLEESALTSSCVDDTFYILKACLQQGCATRDAECLAALINSLSRTIEIDYLNVLQKKLSTAFADKEGKDSNRVLFMTTLNNLDMSGEYIIKLVDHIDQSLYYQFSESDIEKIRACWDCLKDFATSFLRVQKTWQETYFNSVIRPKLKQIIPGTLSYNLADSDALDTTSFITKVKKQFIALTGSLGGMTPRNCLGVTNLMVDYFTRDWERCVLALHVSEIGASRFDTEVRQMTSFFVGNTYATRDKMSRLHQISIVLNTATVDEVLGSWGDNSGAIVWRFSGAQIKKILHLRVEFDKRQIEDLVL